jgi:hypothetical protein
MLFMKDWKAAGALINPNGMILYSNDPNLPESQGQTKKRMINRPLLIPAGEVAPSAKNTGTGDARRRVGIWCSKQLPG